LGSGADMFALALLSQVLKVGSRFAYRSLGAIKWCSLDFVLRLLSCGVCVGSVARG
jgi:hypothetical protein